jgi:hypothetical protein
MINPFKIGIFKKMLSSRLGKVLFEGKEQPGVVYIPYGMFANIEENIPSGVLLDQGNEESLLLLPFDIENREELEEGEVGFGIPSLKTRIIFKKNGDVQVSNENGIFELKENGQFKANGFTVDP